VACARDGTEKYLLAPAAVDGGDVRSATASYATTVGTWIVDVSFTSRGQARFTALTEQALGGQVAIVVDGVVESAPTVQQRITGGMQISGRLTRDEATRLPPPLSSGVLPVPFTASRPTTSLPPGFD